MAVFDFAQSWTRQRLLTVFVLVCIGLYLGLVAGHAPRILALLPLWLALLLGGTPFIAELLRSLFRREFGTDLLAGLSIVTAVLQGAFLVAAIVLLMISGGEMLEEMTRRRATSVLDALAKRVPTVAHRVLPVGIEEVALAALKIGDIIAIYPHETCPADGVVTAGHGRMDEAFLTGEPFAIDKAPGVALISGAINGDTTLQMRVTALPQDSRYARIMKVMEETQQRRPHLRRLADRLGAWYTPLAIVIAAAAALLAQDARRFLAVLVIATPCPLLIAIPTALVGAISLCARRGIVVKDPAILERIDTCATAIFDKTGTLTHGRPSLTDITLAGGVNRPTVLRLAAGLERYSKHPLAWAIMRAAEEEGVLLEAAEEISERPGEGLRGTVAGRSVGVIGRAQAEAAGIAVPARETGLECIVLVDGALAAVFRFHDAPREEGRSFISHLGPRHRFSRILLVSGDRDEEVRYLAGQMGINLVYAGQTPEEKVAITRRETAAQRTLFVGDGVNDAPAMQAATVALALGAHSDVAAQAADAVILEPSLAKVDELIHIGRRMRTIALQSALGGMALSLAGMALAAAGRLPPIDGAIAQELIDLAAVLNAVRVALPPSWLTDF